MKTKKSKRNRRVLKRYTAEDRNKYVEEYKKSGLIPAEFCRKKGINAVTFAGWLKKASNPKVEFIEVSLPPVSPTNINHAVEVKLFCGAEINIPADMETERIADLIRRIAGC